MKGFQRGKFPLFRRSEFRKSPPSRGKTKVYCRLHQNNSKVAETISKAPWTPPWILSGAGDRAQLRDSQEASGRWGSWQRPRPGIWSPGLWGITIGSLIVTEQLPFHRPSWLQNAACLLFPSVPSTPLSVRHCFCHHFIEKETNVRKVK